MGRDLKGEARHIFEAGLEAVDPKEAVKRFVALEGSILRIGKKQLDLSAFNEVWAIGCGKGSAAMAQAIEEILGEFLSGGLVVVKHGYLAPLRKIRLVEAGHPMPDERGWRAAQEIAEKAAQCGVQDLVLFLCLVRERIPYPVFSRLLALIHSHLCW
jgi:hydroxypyruvate reductase